MRLRLFAPSVAQAPESEKESVGCFAFTACLHSIEIRAFVLGHGSLDNEVSHCSMYLQNDGILCVFACMWQPSLFFIFNDLKLQAYLVQYSLILQFPRT